MRRPLSFAVIILTVGGCNARIALSSEFVADAMVGAAEIDGGMPAADPTDASAVEGSSAGDQPLGDAYAEAPALELDGTAVRGTVLDRFTRRPLRGRSISIGGKTATTQDH